MRFREFLLLLCLSHLAFGQTLRPIALVEACSKFGDAVVQVNTDRMSGTGFVVDSNGWVVTALHVVADPITLAVYGNPRVIISGKKTPIPAEIASPLDKLASTRDFVILKIEKTELPKLDLGGEDEIKLGSQVSIIGFPLSAVFPRTGLPVPKFCLTGTIAAQTALSLGNLEYLHTIYFQGVSIKGLSGAPIILLNTGKVIGIVTTKLTGINKSLEEVGDRIKGGTGMEMTFGPNMGVISSLGQVIDVLDTQLANGLGSGTGASDAADALRKAQRGYKREKK